MQFVGKGGGGAGALFSGRPSQEGRREQCTEPTGKIGVKGNGTESVGGVDVYEQRAQVRWDRDGQG